MRPQKNNSGNVKKKDEMPYQSILQSPPCRVIAQKTYTEMQRLRAQLAKKSRTLMEQDPDLA